MDDFPFGMFAGKVGNAAVGHAAVGRVDHIQKGMGKKIEAALVGVLANDQKRIATALDHGLAVVSGFVPNFVVGKVDIVTPAFPYLGIVEQYAAVSDHVADGVYAQIQNLVYWFDVLAHAHWGFVEVDARVATVRFEDDFVLLAHKCVFPIMYYCGSSGGFSLEAV